MPIPPRDEPLTEQDILDSLFNNFHQLQTAQCEFEDLWHDTGQGEHLPDEQHVKNLLRTIRSHADLLDFAYTSLRVMRQYPDWNWDPNKKRAAGRMSAN